MHWVKSDISSDSNPIQKYDIVETVKNALNQKAEQPRLSVLKAAK